MLLLSFNCEFSGENQGLRLPSVAFEGLKLPSVAFEGLKLPSVAFEGQGDNPELMTDRLTD
jgi:hypothetical protein